MYVIGYSCLNCNTKIRNKIYNTTYYEIILHKKGKKMRKIREKRVVLLNDRWKMKAKPLKNFHLRTQEEKNNQIESKNAKNMVNNQRIFCLGE